MQHKTWLSLLCLSLLAAVTACGSNVSGTTNPTPTSLDINKVGGVEILLEAFCDTETSSRCTSAQLAQLADDRTIIGQRATDGLGVAAPGVQLEGTDRILVELPGVKNAQDAINLTSQTGLLQFIDTGAVQLPLGCEVTNPESACYAHPPYAVVFTGSDLDPGSIKATVDPNSGQPAIFFQFKSNKQNAFAQYTQSRIGEFLTITLDYRVIESAVIESEIIGQGEIQGGNMTLDQAQITAALMRSGALPVPLVVVSEHVITPSGG